MEHVEIERKWLMDGFPDLPVASEVEIQQGYLAFEPVTVRVRKATLHAGEKSYTTWRLTVKGQGTLARAEVEVDMDEEQYEALLGLLAAPAANKLLRYYALPDGYHLECSLVDEGQPTAFYYAEVEFDSIEEANAFVPPPFLGREVTEEPGHSMAAYCRRKAAPPPAEG
ncbi:hypothetical protein LJC04_05315 [Ruminococcaceae bacterium OttesenSCG-928-O06]|nr:hypothetical protein [Ruminococcaceae bacterium OttesenSCG-928-O06]